MGKVKDFLATYSGAISETELAKHLTECEAKYGFASISDSHVTQEFILLELPDAARAQTTPEYGPTCVAAYATPVKRQSPIQTGPIVTLIWKDQAAFDKTLGPIAAVPTNTHIRTPVHIDALPRV